MAYLSGNTSGRLEQGTLTPATHAAELLEPTGECSTGDADQRRQGDPRGRQGGRENPRRTGEAGRRPCHGPTVEGQASQTGVHSQSQRQTQTAWDSRGK